MSEQQPSMTFRVGEQEIEARPDNSHLILHRLGQMAIGEYEQPMGRADYIYLQDSETSANVMFREQFEEEAFERISNFFLDNNFTVVMNKQEVDDKIKSLMEEYLETCAQSGAEDLDEELEKLLGHIEPTEDEELN